MPTFEPDPPARAHVDADLLLAHVADIVALVDEDGRWTRVSHSVEGVLGYAPDELVGQRVDEILSGHTGDLFGDPPPPRTELQAERRDGVLLWLELDVRRLPAEADVSGFVITARDITDRRERQQELTAEALRDPLTSLSNRPHFVTVVTRALQRLRRQPGVVALLFMDLDRFKDVNDQFGHATGDAVLVETARRLSTVLRDTDVAARIGGDEFVVCCQDLSDAAEIRTIAERTLLAVREPFLLRGSEAIELTASMGVAIASGPVHPGALLADADSAMYRAKREGAGSVVLVHTRSAAARAMTPPLEAALRRRELRIALQPVARIGDGRVVAAEALLRWRHPHLGLVSPWSFVDELGAIDVSAPISLWVLEQVCGSLALDLDVSVNVSVKDLADARFLRQLSASADEQGVDVSRLCVEVRDGPELTGTRARRALDALQAAGVGLVIDGFPGPSSSMSDLERLRPRAVKLHARLIADLERCPRSRDLVGGLTSVIRSSGTATVATGVERPEQEALLRPLGIDLVQGNHVSPPLPRHTFIDRFARDDERFVPPPPPAPRQEISWKPN